MQAVHRRTAPIREAVGQTDGIHSRNTIKTKNESADEPTSSARELGRCQDASSAICDLRHKDGSVKMNPVKQRPMQLTISRFVLYANGRLPGKWSFHIRMYGEDVARESSELKHPRLAPATKRPGRRRRDESARRGAHIGPMTSNKQAHRPDGIGATIKCRRPSARA